MKPAPRNICFEQTTIVLENQEELQPTCEHELEQVDKVETMDANYAPDQMGQMCKARKNYSLPTLKFLSSSS